MFIDYSKRQQSSGQKQNKTPQTIRSLACHPNNIMMVEKSIRLQHFLSHITAIFFFTMLYSAFRVYLLSKQQHTIQSIFNCETFSIAKHFPFAHFRCDDCVPNFAHLIFIQFISHLHICSEMFTIVLRLSYRNIKQIVSFLPYFFGFFASFARSLKSFQLCMLLCRAPHSQSRSDTLYVILLMLLLL